MQSSSRSTPFISTDSRLLWREKMVGSSYVCFEGGKGNYDTPPQNDIVAIEEDDLLFFTLVMRTVAPHWGQYYCYTYIHKEQ